MGLTENKELVAIIEENNLEKTQGQVILDNFSSFIKEASQWESKAKTIVITNVLQVEKMAEARGARLALKSIRVNVENVRKSLKEKALREGKAIDGIANVIKALIVPLEEYLETQEKFAETLEAERIAKKNEERAFELAKYVEDITLYNFKDMPDEVFDNLILKVKTVFDAEQEAKKKTEQERIGNEKKEKAEQERIKAENEKLKKEAEPREKELTKERAEQEKKLEAEKEKAKKEAEAREKAEAELKAKEEEEKRKKKETEEKEKAEKLAILEAERQAKLMPEREKIVAYSERIKNLESPTDLSVAGRVIVEEAEKKLLAISQEIKIKIKSL